MLSNSKKELLLATHNEHKKEEIQQILGENYKVISLTDVGIFDEIIEDGNTFHENSFIKANYCFQKTGKTSIGDDSGLVIPALDGRPGIFSARYAGNHDFKANIAKVLDEMKNIQNREAYFVTVMCMVNTDGAEYFEGRVYGTITETVFGEKGFGYDPIFIPNHHNITFAQMPAEEKNKISHRKNAIDLLLDFIEK